MPQASFQLSFYQTRYETYKLFVVQVYCCMHFVSANRNCTCGDFLVPERLNNPRISWDWNRQELHNTMRKYQVQHSSKHTNTTKQVQWSLHPHISITVDPSKGQCLTDTAIVEEIDVEYLAVQLLPSALGICVRHAIACQNGSRHVWMGAASHVDVWFSTAMTIWGGWARQLVELNPSSFEW